MKYSSEKFLDYLEELETNPGPEGLDPNYEFASLAPAGEAEFNWFAQAMEWPERANQDLNPERELRF